MKNIVIFGAPGCGKGTQSAQLIDHYGFEHISTGNVLRNEIKKNTKLGEIAKSYIDKGNLIPDDLMIRILADVYDKAGQVSGVIFDGFPRTIPQAEALEKMLKERGGEVDIMLDLDVPHDELVKRLIERGKVSGRADDNAETIKKRLVIYDTQTKPLIEWYKQKGVYEHIHGVGELDKILEDICKAIDALDKK